MVEREAPPPHRMSSVGSRTGGARRPGRAGVPARPRRRRTGRGVVGTSSAPGRLACRRDAANSPSLLNGPATHAVLRALGVRSFFPAPHAASATSEHRLGQQLLELAVLFVERLQAALRPRPPCRRSANATCKKVASLMPWRPADLSDRQPSLLLLQDADDLLFAETRLFFIVRLLIDGPKLQNEGSQGARSRCPKLGQAAKTVGCDVRRDCGRLWHRWLDYRLPDIGQAASGQAYTALSRVARTSTSLSRTSEERRGSTSGRTVGLGKQGRPRAICPRCRTPRASLVVRQLGSRR